MTTKREQIIVEDVIKEELTNAGHTHHTRNNSRTYTHLHKDLVFNMQGEQILMNQDTFGNRRYTLVPPHQDATNNIHNHMMATKACFAQLGTQAAVKEFGQDTVAAILKEVTQLEGKKTFMARAIHELTKIK